MIRKESARKESLLDMARLQQGDDLVDEMTSFIYMKHENAKKEPSPFEQPASKSILRGDKEWPRPYVATLKTNLNETGGKRMT